MNPDEYEVFIGYQLEKALTAEQMETVRVLMELSGLNREAIRFKSEEMSAFYSIYGGIFFVGMFLAALFLMATVMIIYYKQMSEGYEDQKRFQILSNVGLTEKEAKESIRTQVILPSGRSSDYAYDRGKQRGQTFFTDDTDRGYLYL